MSLALDHLVNKNCFFFACPNWIYEDSLLETNALWEIANQVYLRPRRHQALSFVLPFLVCELRIANSKQYLRLLLIYGHEVSSMIGSVNHLMKQEKGMKAWVTQLNFELNLNSIGDIGNRLLEKSYQYDFICFLRFHEPHHKTLKGHWEKVELINSD
ncbi:hypothetical protein G6677_03850 [Polynucleobacter paneuropaeus]|jgi:hypothetical protein|uniref:Uncharacterized protein n=1 Tax=Polynucleobacter paneuropaeus TaxID=2527775 RepID=A0AAE3CGS9_9BURK|nr:hypothetical protein [Polynucleobacter paneuropaeus]MBT8590306.1 hypothetical protein [Polynucleobacter paneuropaeus]MBT8590323.1 hypothetical protein [Polynucleobacter paneuropaeus]MBT8595699.1 hypothetical protein [Polynucleobacter paneuropaeus]MBT8597526.1 hypothetical protein [Polynucleobacter paneuropaeus]